MGHSRSLEMAPFDIFHTSAYQHSTLTMALSCIVLVEKILLFFHIPPAFDTRH